MSDVRCQGMQGFPFGIWVFRFCSSSLEFGICLLGFDSSYFDFRISCFPLWDLVFWNFELRQLDYCLLPIVYCQLPTLLP